MLVPVRSCVKVAGVLIILELGHKFGLLPEEGVPIDVVEEWVLLDLVCAPGAQAIERVLLQQLGHEVPGVFGQCPVVVLGPLDLVIDDVSKEFLGGLPKEGYTAD